MKSRLPEFEHESKEILYGGIEKAGADSDTRSQSHTCSSSSSTYVGRRYFNKMPQEKESDILNE